MLNKDVARGRQLASLGLLRLSVYFPGQEQMKSQKYHFRLLPNDTVQIKMWSWVATVGDCLWDKPLQEFLCLSKQKFCGLKKMEIGFIKLLIYKKIHFPLRHELQAWYDTILLIIYIFFITWCQRNHMNSVLCAWANKTRDRFSASF